MSTEPLAHASVQRGVVRFHSLGTRGRNAQLVSSHAAHPSHFPRYFSISCNAVEWVLFFFACLLVGNARVSPNQKTMAMTTLKYQPRCAIPIPRITRRPSLVRPWQVHPNVYAEQFFNHFNEKFVGKQAAINGRCPAPSLGTSLSADINANATETKADNVAKQGNSSSHTEVELSGVHLDA